MCHRVVYCDGGPRECRELNRHVTNMKIEPENEKPEFVVKTQESMICVTKKTSEVFCFLYKGGTTIRFIPQYLVGYILVYDTNTICVLMHSCCGPRGDGRRVGLARKDLLELQRWEAVYGISNWTVALKGSRCQDWHLKLPYIYKHVCTVRGSGVRRPRNHYSTDVRICLCVCVCVTKDVWTRALFLYFNNYILSLLISAA